MPSVITPKQIQPHHLHHSILREYDIRGIVGETLTEIDAYYIGLTFSCLAKEDNEHLKKIIVARDGRNSSPMLTTALIDGILDSGCNVDFLGVGPTPLLYYAASQSPKSSAIMVTGSHNPSEYNGFKFVFNGKSFYGNQVKQLGQLIAQGHDIVSQKGILNLENQEEIQQQYIDTLVNVVMNKNSLKVAWDPANGAACPILNNLLSKLPGEHFVINSQLDGNFPNHHPDPTVEENLQQLIKAVRDNNCDFGIGFDGDADRIGLVDQHGRIIWGDELLAIFANDILDDHPNATIIADVKSSQSLFDIIQERGGKGMMSKTGHSLIKASMAANNAILAGEMSGHIFFADQYYGFDDGIYAAMRMIDLVARKGCNVFAQMQRRFNTFATKELRIDCADDIKFKVVEQLKLLLTEDNIIFNDIDGIRLSQNNGWWLLRASNTQAALVARCEGQNQEQLELLKASLAGYLAKLDISITF